MCRAQRQSVSEGHSLGITPEQREVVSSKEKSA